MAKLAAWMKAKAQIEASDLASSLVPLMLPAVKNIDDYDILPQGKDKKTGSQAGKVTKDSNIVLKESTVAEKTVNTPITQALLKWGQFDRTNTASLLDRI